MFLRGDFSGGSNQTVTLLQSSSDVGQTKGLGRWRDMGRWLGQRTLVRHVALAARAVMRGWGWDGTGRLLSGLQRQHRACVAQTRRRVLLRSAGHAKYILDGNAICRSKNVTTGAAAVSQQPCQFNPPLLWKCQR